MKECLSQPPAHTYIHTPKGKIQQTVRRVGLEESVRFAFLRGAWREALAVVVFSKCPVWSFGSHCFASQSLLSFCSPGTLDFLYPLYVLQNLMKTVSLQVQNGLYTEMPLQQLAWVWLTSGRSQKELCKSLWAGFPHILQTGKCGWGPKG